LYHGGGLGSHGFIIAVGEAITRRRKGG